MTRPLIVLSNDDGVQDAGLHTLAAAIGRDYDTLVVAPDRERSASSHAISLGRPLRVREQENGFLAVDGTPVDCVYLGLLHFCSRKPAVLISGINRGYNLGMDVFYSGTVAAAVEAVIRGIPAIAISRAVTETDASTAAEFARALVPWLMNEERPRLINVNVPPGRPECYRVTRLGRRIYRDRVEARLDPHGHQYFWIGGPGLGHDPIENSDCEAVTQNLISVTPLAIDWTETAIHSPADAPGFVRG